MMQVNAVIVGGGIVGLATAFELTNRFPDWKLAVLEKEPQLAEHQTGRNSGVLHSGIYYRPGSLRAQNCRAGKLAMQAFCDQYSVPYEICGKVIVATSEADLPQLQKIHERGIANQVPCEVIGPERLRELEPHAAGIRAIHVAESGIINYKQVCLKLAEILRERSCEIWTSAAATGIHLSDSGVEVETSRGVVRGKYVINCGGLYSDRLAKLSGQPTAARIIPFRGEYYELLPEARHLCRNLIYPVPDPDFPFLGVHFTRMIQGGVECGPNAVFAFAREGYTKWTINWRDLREAIAFSGFRKLAWKHWATGMGEMWRSFSKAAFVKALQRLVPDVRAHHLVPARAGVRAQALQPDGQLVDDFLILEHNRVINVCNAPSPAATSSLNVGKLVVDRLVALQPAKK